MIDIKLLLTVLLFIGGAFNLGFAIYHCFFWKAFGWKQELALLKRINRNVFQIINLCLTLILFFFAFISFVYVPDLIGTNLGRGFMLFISLFWFLRAVEQIVFFGLKNRQSVIFAIIFFAGCLLYLMPFLLVNYLTLQ